MKIEFTTRGGDVFEQITNEGYTDEIFIGEISDFTSDDLEKLGLEV